MVELSAFVRKANFKFTKCIFVNSLKCHLTFLLPLSLCDFSPESLCKTATN